MSCAFLSDLRTHDMPVFSGLIFIALIVLFLASGIGCTICYAKRRHLGVGLYAIPTIVLGFYFADALFGPFQFSSPRATFKYALGFNAPAGATNLVAWKKEAFNPGVTIYLRFTAATNSIAQILYAGRFAPSTSKEFRDAQRHPRRPEWWDPSRLTSFWKSSDFAGPYAFHDAYVGYAVSSQTVWVYVNAFE